MECCFGQDAARELSLRLADSVGAQKACLGSGRLVLIRDRTKRGEVEGSHFHVRQIVGSSIYRVCVSCDWYVHVRGCCRWESSSTTRLLPYAERRRTHMLHGFVQYLSVAFITVLPVYQGTFPSSSFPAKAKLLGCFIHVRAYS